MILLYPEAQTDITADSENTSYPAINLFDNKPSKPWKAADGVTSATLTMDIDSGAKYLYIGKTNADEATVVIKNGAGVTQSTTEFELTSGTRRWNRFWCGYTQLDEAHTAEITLETASETVYAGIARAGPGIVTDNPKFGLKNAPKDNSIIQEMSNGALYIRKRDVVRNYRGSLLISMSQFYALQDFYLANGPLPIAMLIAEGVNDYQWCCFGHFIAPLDESYEYPDYGEMSIDILEAV